MFMLFRFFPAMGDESDLRKVSIGAIEVCAQGALDNLTGMFMNDLIEP